MPSSTVRPAEVGHRINPQTKRLIPPNANAAFRNNTPVPRNQNKTFIRRNKKNKMTRVRFPNLPNQSHLGPAPNSNTPSNNQANLNRARQEAKMNDPLMLEIFTQRHPLGKISAVTGKNISGLKRSVTPNEAINHARRVHEHVLNQYDANSSGGRKKTRKIKRSHR
jgi:hypothetical protein